jgi:curved DNA-binding protein CbpA
MNSPLKDYYKLLNLAPTATADEIKRRYRELARRYHPDVNPSPDAAQQIKSINEAYHHLGDVERRATYDAERLLRPDTSPLRRGNRPSAGTSPRGAAQPTPGEATGPAGRQAPHASPEFNGYGRVPHETTRTQTRATRVGEATSSVASEAVERLITDAKLAYISRRYTEAERLCREALALDRRLAVAHEMLGDIFARRGDREHATAAYSYAIQFNPRSQSAQVKLEHILGRHSRPRQPAMTHPLREPFLLRLLRGPGRDLFLMFVSLLSLVGIAVVLMVFYDNPGVPTLTDELSVNLFVAMGATGTLAGLLLALYGGVRPMAQEMVVYGRQQSGLSGALVLTALVSFYFSLIVYVCVALKQNRFSLSVLRVYGVTICLVLLFVWMYHPAHIAGVSVQAVVFAGNVLFPALVLGWRLGDWLRLGGA